MSDTFLIAIDDGHSEVKVSYFEDGTSGPIKNIAFPSRTLRGWEEMDSNGNASEDAYLTFEDAEADTSDIEAGSRLMVVGNGRSAGGHENRTEDFPVSDRNRVLVHHALKQVLGNREANVVLSTALPFSEFHLPSNGQHNTALIEKKKASLAKPVLSMNPATLKPQTEAFSIVDQSVFSEGVAAFFNSMIDYDGEAVSLNEKFAGRFEYASEYAVVDIGGKTTDIVFGSWSGDGAKQPTINIATSTSLPSGTLDAASDLEAALKQAFNMRRIIDPERALFQGKVPIFGEVQDITTHTKIVTDKLFQKIRDPLKKELEDGSSVAIVIFAGGGSVLLKNQLSTLFNPAVSLFPENSRYANANGMLKMMKLAHS